MMSIPNLGEGKMRALRADKGRSEEHTSELQSQSNLVCRLLLEKKKKYCVDHNNAPSSRNYVTQHVDTDSTIANMYVKADVQMHISHARYNSYYALIRGHSLDQP